MKFLIEKGVPATYTDINNNQTVLYYVAKEGKANCVDLLVKQGCNVNHRDCNAQTPIYYSAREGHLETCQKLISYGTDINLEDSIGRTAIFYSAAEGHKEVTELFLKNGALPNKAAKNKQTPLQVAKKNGKMEIVELLTKYGAPPPKEKTQEKPKIAKKAPASSPDKKSVDKNAPKKYVLTLYKDGIWRPMTSEELKDFMSKNTEIAKYLQNPSLIDSLPLPEIKPDVQLYDHWDKAAKRILNFMWKLHGANHFHEPVNPIAWNIPDYPEVVKNPMDLGTIRQKLNTCAYKNCKEFVNDMNLVFSNCILYNGETSEFGILAKNLREEFKQQCQIMDLEYYM